MDQNFLQVSVAAMAVKVAVSTGIGMLIGMEREWANKETGVRTFAIVTLMGTLAAVIGRHFTLGCLAGVFLLILFKNARSLLAGQTLETTTCAVLIMNYSLGVLVGLGHIFAPVTGAIVVMALLACKTELNRFTGALQPSEIRSVILLGLIGFVIFPLIPDRYVDDWQLFNPHDAWVGIVAICGISFVNYIFLRIFRARGLFLSALFGGLVNSTATVAELSTSTKEYGLLHKLDKFCLTTIVAMFIRNLAIVAMLSPASFVRILPPICGMTLVAGLLAFGTDKKKNFKQTQVPLNLHSPISLKKVFSFAALFLAIQIAGTLLTKTFGNYGLLVTGAMGGLASSASTTAAAAGMATHSLISAPLAGVVAVVSSLSSTIVNVPIIYKLVDDKRIRHKIIFHMLIMILTGGLILTLEHFLHFLAWFK